jgi:DNA-binding PucR family transcriptional regulator
VELAGLPEAYQEASTAFATAWTLGLEGTHALADLGIQGAVQAAPEVGRALRERYLAPLHGSGTLRADLLATTRAYLECGNSREAAAARLHVHQNTVGYRLNRFTELTGADLSRLSTLAELHWLFIDLELRPPSAEDA